MAASDVPHQHDERDRRPAVRISNASNGVTVIVRGELDATTARKLRRVLLALSALAAVDLRAVGHMDPVGLLTLKQVMDARARDNGGLRLVADGALRQALDEAESSIDGARRHVAAQVADSGARSCGGGTVAGPAA